MQRVQMMLLGEKAYTLAERLHIERLHIMEEGKGHRARQTLARALRYHYGQAVQLIAGAPCRHINAS